MKLLIRIAFVITIVACIGAAYFARQLGVKRDELQTETTSLTTQKTKLTKDLADTHTDLTAAKKNLTKAQDNLTEAQKFVEASKNALATKTQEAEKLQTSLSASTAELSQIKTDRDTAQQTIKKIQDSLAAAGVADVGNIDQLRDKIVAQTEENQLLGKQLTAARDANAEITQKLNNVVAVPNNLRGRVAVVQDNWDFIVLNLGRNQHVQPKTEFIVYRADKMVAKVQAQTVGENTCIAEVLPGFQLAQPRVGDIVVH